MKEFTIGKNDAGQRLDRWLAKTLPLLPAPLAQKYIRLKRVKVNGKAPSGMCGSSWGTYSSYTSTMSSSSSQGGERLSERLQAPPGHRL